MGASVLDSFALLAWLRDETGAAAVESLLERAHQRALLMTEVNYAEVKYIVLRKDGVAKWQWVRDALKSLPIRFVPVDRELADLAADFKAAHSMSLADACAAALALMTKSKLVTGDREFEAVAGKVSIQWLK